MFAVAACAAASPSRTLLLDNDDGEDLGRRKETKIICGTLLNLRLILFFFPCCCGLLLLFVVFDFVVFQCFIHDVESIFCSESTFAVIGRSTCSVSCLLRNNKRRIMLGILLLPSVVRIPKVRDSSSFTGEV